LKFTSIAVELLIQSYNAKHLSPKYRKVTIYSKSVFIASKIILFRYAMWD